MSCYMSILYCTVEVLNSALTLVTMVVIKNLRLFGKKKKKKN
jgi:hypothetical protein